MNDYDFIYKIILCGDSVGKTSFLNRYIDNNFIDNPSPTINLDFCYKVIELEDGKKVKLRIWDIPGQDDFPSNRRGYFKGAHGIILFYDISNRESFKNLEYWLDLINNSISESPHIVLVGNKIDLEKERKITAEETKISDAQAIISAKNTIIENATKELEKQNAELVTATSAKTAAEEEKRGAEAKEIETLRNLVDKTEAQTAAQNTLKAEEKKVELAQTAYDEAKAAAESARTNADNAKHGVQTQNKSPVTGQ